jgi:hypothetical protein
MTWQEELRQLDSRLADGELAANEYRKRRDEILAAASSAQPPSPVIGPPTGPQPIVVADSGDHGDNAEVTQVVTVKNGEADETQIIDAATVADTVANVENGSAGTQAPPPPAQPQAPPAPAMPQPQTWSAQPPPPQTGPPGMVPPQPMHGPSVTPMDAQDLFTSNKPPAGSRKPWLLVVAVVVVLAIVGGAVWFFGFRDSGGTDTAQTPQNEPTSESQAPPPPPVDIADITLPGTPGKINGEMDIARAGELGAIAASEGALIADAGAKKLVYSGSADGDLRYLLYSYKSADASAAAELTGKLLDIQKQLGYKEITVEGVPASVTVTSVANDKAISIRGVYTYGDTTIQLSLLQIPAGDAGTLHTRFKDAMTTVTEAAPPQE